MVTGPRTHLGTAVRVRFARPMKIDLTESVAAGTDAGTLWRRVLEPGAVIGLLGGTTSDVRDYADPDEPAARGHTFRSTGIGGGLYHARIDECVEPVTVSYVIWRDDAPETVALLTWSIAVERSRTVLTGTLNMDLPVETLLASFSPATALALPIVQPFVARSVRNRLRQRLVAMADGAR